MVFSPEMRAQTQNNSQDMYVGEQSPAVIRAREIASRPIGTSPISVIDIETTGPSFLRGDRIVKIAIRRVDPDGRFQDYIRIVNPLRSIPDEMVGVTDIPLDEIGSALPFKGIKDEIRAQMEDSIVVAHDAPDVIHFLAYEYEVHDELPPILPLVCTQRLAMKNGNGERSTLAHLRREFDVKVDKNLDYAQTDLQLTDQVFRHLVQSIQHRYPDTHTYVDLMRLMGTTYEDLLTVKLSTEEKIRYLQTLRVFKYTGEVLSFEYRTSRSEVVKFRRAKIIDVVGRHFRGIDLDDPERKHRTFNIGGIVSIV